MRETQDRNRDRQTGTEIWKNQCFLKMEYTNDTGSAQDWLLGKLALPCPLPQPE